MMSNKAGFIPGLMILGVLVTAPVFADETSPEKLAEQCKKEAVETGVRPGDIAAYVKECLSDYGVDEVDAEKIMEQLKLKDQSGD